jgi:hypothetical protein
MDGKKHIVGLVELYAVVLARYRWDHLLRGCRVIFFVDNVPPPRSSGEELLGRLGAY